MVRKDREMERMQRSLREFIDDVAPVQLQVSFFFVLYFSLLREMERM